jgi:hypothetical protein
MSEGEEASTCPSTPNDEHIVDAKYNIVDHILRCNERRQVTSTIGRGTVTVEFPLIKQLKVKIKEYLQEVTTTKTMIAQLPLLKSNPNVNVETLAL